MLRIIAVDMGNGLVDRIHQLQGKDIIQIFSSPILFCSRDKTIHQGAGFFIRPDLHLLLIQSFEDIVKADSIALGDPASVPAGQYSEEALTNLGLWDQIQDKTSFGTNVTEVLNQVAACSADAGIVYATDAASMADQVEVVAEAPEGSLKTKVIYPVAVVKDSANAEVAANFVEFLTTDEAMKVFEAYGFNKGE